MSHTAKRMVIIGGGPAGYEAASAATKYGAKVTLIDDLAPGGNSVLLDCVPSKSFIAGANIKTDLRRADDMGLNEGIGETNLSVKALNERVQVLANEQSADIAEGLEELGVRVIKGRASFEEMVSGVTHLVTATHSEDGREELIPCDLVLLATGASPRILPGARPDGERILTWQQIYNLEELPEHLIVVGSGVTGAEFVSAFSELDVKVTMVASRDRILPQDDADAADTLEEVLAERGVELEKHARVSEVKRTDGDGGEGVVVITDDGREIHGSHALLSIGSIPNTSNMGLERLGVEMEKSGHIKVDRVSRTNVPNVYAAGDCSNLFPLASVAAMQGRIAAYHALGEGVSPLRLKTVATAVFTRPEIAAVGVTEKEIEDGEVLARKFKLPLHTNPRAKMRSLRHGFVKIFCRGQSDLVIGGVVVAPHASELILPIAVAVANNLTVTDLADSFAVYPSLSGSITEAARRLIAPDTLT